METYSCLSRYMEVSQCGFFMEVALTLLSYFVLPVCQALYSVGPGLFYSSSLVLTPGIHLPGPSVEPAPFHLLEVMESLCHGSCM